MQLILTFKLNLYLPNVTYSIPDVVHQEDGIFSLPFHPKNPWV